VHSKIPEASSTDWGVKRTSTLCCTSS